jgi:D,D-heptose 1,7-bisphosphate phosphatase
VLTQNLQAPTTAEAGAVRPVAGQAVILAGGLGTRLGAVTRHTPKPLLEVGGRPFLDHLVWNLARHGLRRILLLTGHLAPMFEARYGNGRDHGVAIEYAVEAEPLGTGGALRHARTRLEERFVLVNGDTLFDLNYLDLMARLRGGALAVVALRGVDDVERYGAVRLGGDGRVLGFAEKAASGAGMINGGVYALRRDAVERLLHGSSSLERHLFPELVADGGLAGQAYGGFFVDIGVPEAFARAQTSVANWRRKPALLIDRDGTLNVDRGWVHRPEDFAWNDGAREAIRWANDRGILVLVVTNQAGIARGHYSEEDFRAFTNWIDGELAAVGAHVDATYYCPHHPTAGRGVFRRECVCRKPAAGLIERALADWGFDPARSVMVGNAEHDVEAAAGAGIRAARFVGGSLLECVKGAFSDEGSALPGGGGIDIDAGG